MYKTLLVSVVILAALVRIVWLDRFPVSLFSDEANQAYNAISILKTARDEHGVFLPVSLRSFGDWKPPLQTYLMIPFFAAGMPIEYSTRLPSALLGTGTVLLLYFFLRYSIGTEKRIALLAVFFLAVSPWHILQSRSAMLVGPSLFFLLAGVHCFFQAKRISVLLPVSGMCFALALYGYYGMRLVVPLLFLCFVIGQREYVRRAWKMMVTALFVFSLFMLPLFIAFLHEPNVVFGRARTVSVFYDPGTRMRQRELITQDGMDADVHLTSFFHSSVFLYGRSIAGRFLSHFDLTYLFFVGDRAQPFQISHMGIFYLADSILLMFGTIALVKSYAMAPVLVWWLLIAVFPAAMTFLTPSSNRSFFAVIPLMAILACGMNAMRLFAGRRPMILSLVVLAYMVNASFFLRQFFIVMPKEHGHWWYCCWKDTVKFVQTIARPDQNIIVFDGGDMWYIYFLLYGQVDPEYFQKNFQRTYVVDQMGFEHVEGFGNYTFINDRVWKDHKDDHLPGSIYVIPINQAREDKDYTKAIYYPDGSIMAKIFVYE